MDSGTSTYGSSLNDRTKIAVIGDDETIKGFKLTGINEAPETLYRSSSIEKVVYMHTVGGATTDVEIAEMFRKMVERKDVAMLIINQGIAGRIREEISKKTETIPVILEIPSKGQKYTPEHDEALKKLHAKEHKHASA